MPVRPEERSRYPKNWREISAARKEAAWWRCECRGECGRRAPHDGRCPNRHGEPDYATGKRTVLTTAHLDHTPENVALGNLRVMCAPCHLAYDRDHHAETRRARLVVEEQPPEA